MVTCVYCGKKLPNECICNVPKEVKIREYLDKTLREVEIIRDIWFNKKRDLRVRVFHSGKELEVQECRVRKEMDNSSVGVRVEIDLRVPKEMRKEEKTSLEIDLYDEKGLLFRKHAHFTSLVSAETLTISWNLMVW